MLRPTTYAVLLCIFATQYAQGYRGRLIAKDWGVGATHDLEGRVYVINETTIRIYRFVYDGLAPATLFYMGRDKDYASVQRAGVDDMADAVYGDDNPGRTELRRYNDETITLHLPIGRTIKDYTYLSVWCSRVEVYFGGFDLQPNFEPPRPRVLAGLTGRSNRVSSGPIEVPNNKRIIIPNFFYDGRGRANFYVGNTTRVQFQPERYGIIPDENGSRAILGRYTGQTVILRLPKGVTARRIMFISIYSERERRSYGDVLVGERLIVPPPRK